MVQKVYPKSKVFTSFGQSMGILAVLNQKGGSGKTTVSTNLPVELARRGKKSFDH